MEVYTLQSISPHSPHPRLLQFPEEAMKQGQRSPPFRSRLCVTCLTVRRMSRGRFRGWRFVLEDWGEKGDGTNSRGRGGVYISCIDCRRVKSFRYPALSPPQRFLGLFSILQIRKLNWSSDTYDHVIYVYMYVIRRGLYHPYTYCCRLVAQLCPTLLWPHGLQPTRLLCPWGFPGKTPGVGGISFSRGSSRPRDRTRVSALQADSLPLRMCVL